MESIKLKAKLLLCYYCTITKNRGPRGRERMIVGFTATCAISAYHHYRCEFESHSGEVYSIQH